MLAPHPRTSRGQVLLVVLLTMAAALVAVLSVVSRSVTDVGETAREDESGRAFSAAEAGIERALVVGNTIAETQLDNRSSYTVSVANIGAGGLTYNYPAEMAAGDSASVWLVSHAADGDLNCVTGTPCFTGSTVEVCWGKPGLNQGNDTPAIEFSYYYDSTARAGVDNNDWAGVRVARAAIDPLDPTRRDQNKFAAPSAGSCTDINGVAYSYSHTFNLTDLCGGCNTGTRGRSLVAKLRMLYNATPDIFGVRISTSSLPSQGKKLESIGKSGDAARKVEVYQTFGELPPIFDAALFSPGGITKSPNN